MRITITQEIEQRSIAALTASPAASASVLVAAAVAAASIDSPGLGYNVQLVEHQAQILPAASRYSNYYPGATISEIEEPASEAANAVQQNSTAGLMLEHHIPKAVQASPVMVLQEDHQQEQQHRIKLRQKALVDSVESNV